MAVKSEFPDRKDAANFSFGQQQQQQPFPQTAQQQQVQPQPQQLTKQISTYPQQATATCVGSKPDGQANVNPAALVAPSSTSSAALPLSQLLLSPSGLCQARAVTTVTPSATVTHILVPTSSVSTSTQGYSLGSVTTKASVNAQTLVVQPLQQTNVAVDKGPVPIQPKTAQGHRLPVQMPPRHPTAILPALPSTHSQGPPVGHHPPHIPVQLVGARPGAAGNAQALALAPNRGNPAPENTTGGNGGAVAMVKFTAFVYTLGALAEGRTGLREQGALMCIVSCR